jgi:putative tricarboxylic transport membrane protein
MIGFGIGGYFMFKYNYSPAGVLLGIILGPIAEDGLRDLLIISGHNPIPFIFTRPISLLFIAFIVMALYFSVRGKKEAEEHPEIAVKRADD